MFIRLNKRGFTLVEIMIVVAIIGLLAAIAIPNLLRARLNSNEAAAKSNLRTLSTALESFRAAQNPPTYPGSLISLTAAGGANPAYIDDNLGRNQQKQGYTFGYTPLGQTFVGGRLVFLQFRVTATPQRVGVTGNNTYIVDETGVIRDQFNRPIEG